MIKTPKLLSFGLLAALMLITSCNKKDDSSPTPNSDSSWKFGDFTYTRGGSSQDDPSGQNHQGDFVAVVVTTTGDGGDYDAYSGSSLTFSFPNHLGPGKYTLTSDENEVANKGSMVMQVNCTIGTAVNTGAILYSTDNNSGGTADVTIDADGKYHITISKPVVLVKNVVVGGGIDGAKDAYSLSVDNAY